MDEHTTERGAKPISRTTWSEDGWINHAYKEAIMAEQWVNIDHRHCRINHIREHGSGQVWIASAFR